jgi:hypothetical protein
MRPLSPWKVTSDMQLKRIIESGQPVPYTQATRLHVAQSTMTARAEMPWLSAFGECRKGHCLGGNWTQKYRRCEIRRKLREAFNSGQRPN